MTSVTPRSGGHAAPMAAVIFDLDGVLVDTEPLHFAATCALLHPAPLDPAAYARFIGRGGFKQWLIDSYGITRAEIDARYDALFSAELARSGLRPLAGALALLDALRERARAVAVASQSTRAWVQSTLRAAGLAERFAVIATAEEAGADKPAPDVYLLAAQRLGVAPRRCLAVEDSPPVVASALAAGLRVVQSTQASFASPPQPGVHAHIASLEHFDLRWLDGPTP